MSENKVRTLEQGFPAVMVEQPSGELKPYWIDTPDLEPGERRAFILTKPDGEKYRVSLWTHRGWACECKDWGHCTSKKRTRQAGQPCKHVTAVLAALAEPLDETPRDEDVKHGSANRGRSGTGLAGRSGHDEPVPALGEHDRQADRAGAVPTEAAG